MLRKRTLLILGAGSSFDFGFPLGPTLTKSIAAALTLESDGIEIHGGHPAIRRKLSQFRYNRPGLFNAWLDTADFIRRNIHLSSSVDRFIDTHQQNQILVELCKFTIALIISDCEKASPFGVDVQEIGNFDFSNVGNLWTTKLFHFLQTNIHDEGLDSIFDKLRVVTFNYDRVFEQSLAVSLANFYNLTPDVAYQTVSSLDVTHVYGYLGPLGSGQGSRGFGRFGDDTEQATSAIRTFHESVKSSTQVKVAQAIDWAERVYILGFSFANINMEFLRACGRPVNCQKPVFATCLGMSEQNRDVAAGQVNSILCQNYSASRLLDLTCERFFDDLALSI